MNCNHNHDNSNYSRRDFLTKTSLGIGGISLASMLNAENIFASEKIQSYKPNNIGLPPVSYTHLTLPTICSV